MKRPVTAITICSQSHSEEILSRRKKNSTQNQDIQNPVLRLNNFFFNSNFCYVVRALKCGEAYPIVVRFSGVSDILLSKWTLYQLWHIASKHNHWPFMPMSPGGPGGPAHPGCPGSPGGPVLKVTLPVNETSMAPIRQTIIHLLKQKKRSKDELVWVFI